MGLSAALLVLAIGFALEFQRFGGSNDAAIARIRSDVQARFTSTVEATREMARALATDRQTVGAFDGTVRIRNVFSSLAERAGLDDAVTIFDLAGQPLAWTGRPSEIFDRRPLDRPEFFVDSGPLGLRLIAVEPILGGGEAGATARRIGAVAVERELSSVAAGTSGAFLWPSATVDIALETSEVVAGPDDAAFALATADGDALLQAYTSDAELTAARRAWRLAVVGWAALVLGLTSLLLSGPLLDRRDTATSATAYRSAVGALVLALTGARALLAASQASAPSDLVDGGNRLPFDFALGALFWFVLVGLAIDVAVRWRRAVRRGRRDLRGAAVRRRFISEQLIAGVAAAVLLALHATVLAGIEGLSDLSPQQLSPYPWDAARLTALAGLIILEAATLWGTVTILWTSLVRWRVRRAVSWLLVTVWGAWLAPGLIFVSTAALFEASTPDPTMLVSLVAAIGLAWMAPRWTPPLRHASQVTRLMAAFAALLIPALAAYPALMARSDRAQRTLIEERFAPLASSHPADLEAWLDAALLEIDNLSTLPALFEPASAQRPESDDAFQIWRVTELAEFRLTSAIELYSDTGALLSRFALNVPEYAAAAPRRSLGCTWEIFGEASPFSAPDRRMLHAQRSVCVPDGAEERRIGAVVVQLMLDYRVLPFIASDTPYGQLVRRQLGAPVTSYDRDVDVVIYGWGLGRPLFASGQDAWPIDEAMFARIALSRRPFWTTLDKNDATYHVYISNDIAGIYALGFPARRAFDILVDAAELSSLVGLVFLALLFGRAAFSRLARRDRAPGSRLLRELRASFHRKLSLAFVAAAVVPVLVLAVLIRVYFTAQLRADVEAEAVRTAAVARRVIEEIALLQPLPGDRVAPLSDDVMVWISQAIDQDVNIFEGATLLATSERDLYASGLLPTRTPEDVYRALVIDRLPSWVGEASLDELQYVLAATPVGGSDRNTILTVPLTSRQQQIERQIEDLDRGIQLGVVAFILLGGVIGLSMAERVADPIRRLTRVASQIARGDFDVRVAVRSADELQRLVEAFNGMAAELKAQQTELERTHRLEAWAEMARQVAHEIKNPLTPIQLSAEHLRRVHVDRGEPMTPVLEDCVKSILTQVRLLRQISAEFWSFASSPTARPALTRLSDLVREVAEPYRTGLGTHIEVVLDVSSDLPRVLIDPTLTARALTNIVENAIHAMPGGGRLRIAVRLEAGRLALSVTDTGVGMDDDARAHIFEPYFSTRSSGTGLGLTIAKRNVELSGGTIAVGSVPGEGATVTMSFSLDGSPDVSR